MKKEKKIWMSIAKMLLICSLFCVFLLYGNTERTEGALYTGKYYDGVSAVNTWAWDTTEGTGTGIKGSWPENGLAIEGDGYACQYMHWQGWSDPVSWELCKDSGGTWISFKDSNGDWYYLKNVWVQVAGNYFFLDYQGYIVKGWAFVPRSAHHTDTGWNCGWFYLDENGIMQTGWQNIDGKWYYFFINDSIGANPLYEEGECLYDTTGVASLNTVENTTFSKSVNIGGYNYTKIARYVTGFNFKQNIYVQGDSGYALESSNIINVNLDVNSSCSKTIEAPIKIGYYLNTSASSPGAITNSLVLINDDTLSSALTKTDANWYYDRSSYILYLNANGGVLPTQFNNVNLKYQTGDYSDLSWNIPSKDGYSFNGWWTSTSGGIQIYDADGKVKNDGTYWSGGRSIYAREHTLYAQWNAKSYTVTYDANGGTLTSGGPTVTVSYGGAVSLAQKAQKDGMLFAGWGLSPSDKTPLSTYTMPANNVTLYALYSLPISDLQKAEVVSWSIRNTGVYNRFPLTLTKTENGKYTYSLSGINLRRGLTYCRDTDLRYAVVLWDNAGNYRVLQGDTPPIPKQYIQTVNHYLWNMEAESWIFYTSVSELVEEKTTYTPKYLETTPAGYHRHSIDGAYTVTGPATKSAYYMPDSYTLYFDANGGYCDRASKTVYKDCLYGDLPRPEREGYEFTGWYTDKTTGTQVYSDDHYAYAGDSTIYAHWEADKFQVVYDYLTNGGNAVDLSYQETTYGTTVDLSLKAYKKDWEFVGWSTNPKGTTTMSSSDSWKCETCGKTHTLSSMPSHDIVLYSVYKKDITLTIIEQTDSGQTTRTKKETIYNNEVDAGFSMTEELAHTGWTFLGWTDGTSAEDEPVVSVETEYRIAKDSTLYGLYTTNVTLGYDTNGSAMEIDAQTKEKFFNASGDTLYPEFVIADAPVLDQHSFVQWNVSDGIIQNAAGEALNSCAPKDAVRVNYNTTLTATWDKYPEIEAYDRYFTLEEAQNGKITEEELLKKVKGMDKEDGELLNGKDVIVKDYNVSDFLDASSNEEVKITYIARDSFGNVITKTIIVRVTDTTIKKSRIKNYVRFISCNFFKDAEGNLVDASDGGLEETSVWRWDTLRFQLLNEALSNNKSDVERWFFSKEDLKKMKNDL